MGSYSLRPESVRTLFDHIASTYDFLNHLLSAGRDVYWRKMAARELRKIEGPILDLATGTGDVAMALVHHRPSPQKIFGLDFSEPMIRKAQQKIKAKGLLPSIAFGLGDALFLPFHDNTFNACIIAFGLRNIQKKEKALAEMVRVLKKGGKVVVLEFTLPEKKIIRKPYAFYFQKILPRIGGIISGDRGAYAYLPETVSRFPSYSHYEEMMRQSGLNRILSRPFTFGTVSILSGIKDHE